MPLATNALICLEYSDNTGRDETPCHYDATAKTVRLPSQLDDDAPPANLDHPAYLELPDGSRIDLDGCIILA